jgi:FtsP/CotA-like multicopper oxidase with cupredoxin domain
LKETNVNRRDFLKAALTGAAALSLRPGFGGPALAAQSAADPAAKLLSVVRRTIEVNRKAASVFGIVSADGSPGIRLRAGDPFNVNLRNQSAQQTIVHWHGLTPPWPSDGVPDAPQPLIAAGAERAFNFPVRVPGTYWMHAHTLQEQQLLAAPLIVADPGDDGRDEQEVVVLLHDFSFTPPEELLARLQSAKPGAAGVGGMSMGGMDMGSGGMSMGSGGMSMGGMDMGGMKGMDMSGGTMPGMAMDLNDIDYDAYLANDRTLDDPEVFTVEKRGNVRVRIINGATATAFTLDFGALPSTLIAVDGQPVQPVSGRLFPLSMGQRIDVRVTLPDDAKAYPVFALREGGAERTGFFLRPPGAIVEKAATSGEAAGPILDLALEASLRAIEPLADRPSTRVFDLALAGNMAAYQWALTATPQIVVGQGDRVEVTMRNMTMMAHPMHLHGHHFQVVAIDGSRIAGAVRDTVLVPPMRSVTLAVDADNPGQWAFHCHHLYHMASGMMSVFGYAT